MMCMFSAERQKLTRALSVNTPFWPPGSPCPPVPSTCMRPLMVTLSGERPSPEPGERGVVADRDISIIIARFEKERMARGSELARGQCLHLGDRIHRALNRARGPGLVEYGHVRSEVGLHRVNQTERFNKEKIIENFPGGNFHMGLKFLAVRLVSVRHARRTVAC